MKRRDSYADFARAVQAHCRAVRALDEVMRNSSRSAAKLAALQLLITDNILDEDEMLKLLLIAQVTG